MCSHYHIRVILHDSHVRRWHLMMLCTEATKDIRWYPSVTMCNSA